MRLKFLNNGVAMDYETREQKRWLIVSTITAISVTASLFITYLVLLITGYEKLPIIFVIATIAPVVIAPIVSWSVVNLVIEIQKLEAAHLKLATYDDLTGLLRRGPFLTQYASVASVCQRNKLPLAFATLDLDRFKKINDQFGHGAGDQVLREFAEIVRRSLRAGDIAGRIGGEEFAIVLPGTGVEDARHVLERIRSDTETAIMNYLGRSISVTVSGGLTGARSDQVIDGEALIKKSDDLLYQAKNRGRNLIVTDINETQENRQTACA